MPNQPARQQPRPAPITPLPPVGPTFQPGAYASAAPERRRGSNVGLNFFLLILVVVLLFAFGFGAYFYFQHQGTSTGQETAHQHLLSRPGPIPTSGIGVTKETGGEIIGISDGSYALDTAAGRPSSSDMTAGRDNAPERQYERG